MRYKGGLGNKSIIILKELRDGQLWSMINHLIRLIQIIVDGETVRLIL